MFTYEGGHHLCLNCSVALQQMQQAQLRQLFQFYNHTAAEMDAMAASYGVRSRTPQFEIDQPQPVIHQGPFNNFQIDGSVIGAINTGQAQRIDVSLSQINTPDNKKLHDALASFTQTVVNNNEVTNDTKNAVLDLLEVITSEAAKPKEQRNRTLLSTILPTVPTMISAASSLVDLWVKIQPHLANLI